MPDMKPALESSITIRLLKDERDILDAIADSLKRRNGGTVTLTDVIREALHSYIAANWRLVVRDK